MVELSSSSRYNTITLGVYTWRNHLSRMRVAIIPNKQKLRFYCNKFLLKAPPKDVLWEEGIRSQIQKEW